MEQMTHRERVAATIAGRPVNRPPISLWRHFGGIDMSSQGLTDAMVGFQATFDFDFVKFMPTGTWLLHCHINHHTTNDNVEEQGGGGLMLILDVAG